ncbi:MAG TPA: hypothetical protein VHT05_07345 [Candidatus Elarobacter sp.]|nr:hypothetical protein [Candidatus Elarobacter sp.]
MHSNNERPRHFPPHGLFVLEARFDEPLPSQAYLTAALAGPQGLDGGPTTELHSDDSTISDDRRGVRLTGTIPYDCPAGTYKVTSLVLRWQEAPPQWAPVALSFTHLNGAGTIVIDPERVIPRPAVPRLIAFD